MVMEWDYVGAVVITGFVIVFVGLILLIWIVQIMGKIFSSIKTDKISTGDEPVSQVISPAVQNTETEDEEVIAVIAAAVAAMSSETGMSMRIKSIRPVSMASRRKNSWAAAAAAENTNPF